MTQEMSKPACAWYAPSTLNPKLKAQGMGMSAAGMWTTTGSVTEVCQWSTECAVFGATSSETTETVTGHLLSLLKRYQHMFLGAVQAFGFRALATRFLRATYGSMLYQSMPRNPVLTVQVRT